MRNKASFKSIIIIIVILVIFGILFYLWYNSGEVGQGLRADDIPTEPKHYAANEYSSILISDQNMSTRYLNSYLNIISTDLNEAYNLLDEDYRNVKFGNIDNFRRYINERKNTFTDIKSYYVTGNKYYVYDKNNNVFIFSTKGVMTYKVYLDDDTVDITKY